MRRGVWKAEAIELEKGYRSNVFPRDYIGADMNRRQWGGRFIERAITFNREMADRAVAVALTVVMAVKAADYDRQEKNDR